MKSRKLSWIQMTAATVMLIGCADGDRALGPGPEAETDSPRANVVSRLDCVVEMGARRLGCEAPGLSLPAEISAALIGGQGNHLLLESSNVQYDGSDQVFSADVTILNLLDSPLGTTDGATPHADGIRIFFLADPEVTGGSGTVTVKNPTGTAEFTHVDQPYFEYGAPLMRLERSEARRWEWSVPSTVESFTFSVAVSAAIAGDAAEPGPRFDARSLSAGLWHTCALTGAGEAYCWGSNWGGELGNGSNDSSPTPVPVSGGHTFKSIDSGQWHTCGLTTNGEAYCWGQGQQGRLGNGDGNDRYVPEQVAGGLRFVSIASALNHSCGLTAEGTAYCWGRNSEYQLGRAGSSSATPVMVTLPGERLVSIAAGENHTCALTVDGKAYCWGLGSSGQLGAGSGDVHEYPPHTSLPVPVLGNHTFIAISAGGDVSCGIVTDGSAYCWGDGRAGQLGTGSEETAKVWNEPVKVSDVEDFISISNGESHTCGLTRSGTAYCWGSRAKGRIGDTNTSGTAHSPTEVSFAGTFIAIRAFEGHTCAIATDSATYCWGDGSFGQLGNGGTDSKAEPTLVTSFTH